MDFELDEPTMDSNYDDYYDASEGGEPPPAAPAEDSEGGPVVKVEDLEEHEVKEGDVEEHRVKRKHIIRSSWLQISHSFKQPSLIQATLPTSPSLVSPSTPTTPTTPSRHSRLRGFTILRHYTHSHLSSLAGQHPSDPGSQQNSLARSTTCPAQPASPSPASSPSQRDSFGAGRDHLPSLAVKESRGRTSTSTSDSLPAEPDPSDPVTSSSVRNIPGIMARHLAGSAPPGARRARAILTASSTLEAANAGRVDGPPPSEPVNATGSEMQQDGSRAALAGYPQDQPMPTIRFIPHQDPRSTRPSLPFPATSRTLPHEDCVIRVGRYSERDSNPNPPANAPSSAPVGFKSKVVSRKHCEFWCSNGQWYIKDVRSSSGTFLNHIRLSQPNTESRPWPLNDGDVVQLGIDFRGGEEMIFRCVKIRVECNRAWQKGLNNFNMTTHKRLRNLGKTDASSIHSSECSICLMSVAPCQSLFVAPCSHVWHYKCIRPILIDHKTWPQFLCPNCRAVSDLEADVDDPPAGDEWRQADEDEASDPNDVQVSGVNGEDPMEADSNEENDHDASDNGHDKMLATMTTRNLSVGPPISSEQVTAPTPSPALPPSSAPAPTTNLLTRRIGSRPTLPRPGEVTDAASLDIDARKSLSSEKSNATTSQPPPGEAPTAEASSTLRATATRPLESLGADGLTTPRNDAGPFVFDGSAGRGSGPIVVASLAEAIDSPTSTTSYAGTDTSDGVPAPT
ncbi:MAG: SMAD FHA domain-containing [Lasallia pustulata]|uniref:RING-type E3 ubiquitin transferase n=1 Tax=Lasallia pustulata TaxID=136370 RepID=A0A5M8PI17_9LECA|nr:MAG: SMAD FHA domain-containing [Lasallia pustulata]